MKSSILTSDNFKTTNWSGGTTIELFIYPPATDYHKRNFDFRLSTATVEVETSVFTPLPGITRTLMVLDGKMMLSHENHHSKELGQFEVDRFEGGWKTSSLGKCTDFNLMTMGNTAGELSTVSIEANKNIVHAISTQWDWLVVYVYAGRISITFNDQISIISKGDLLVFRESIIPALRIKGIEKSQLIFTTITDRKGVPII